MCPASFSIVGTLVPALTRPSYPFVTCEVLAALRGASDTALVFGVVVGAISGWFAHKLLRRLRALWLVRLERRRLQRAEAIRLAVAYHRRRLAELEGRHAD